MNLEEHERAIRLILAASVFVVVLLLLVLFPFPLEPIYMGPPVMP